MRHGEKSDFPKTKNRFSSLAKPEDVDPFFLVPTTNQPETTTQIATSPMYENSVKPITNFFDEDVSQPLATTNLKFPYTTALTLTIAIGCSLLILNLLVFAAFYYHKESSSEQAMYQNRSTCPLDTLDSNQMSPNVQMQVTNVYKPSSPSHCGTLKSSTTYRSSLGTSCEEECNEEEEEAEGAEEEDWPPEYTVCCQRSLHLPKQSHGVIGSIQQSPSTHQIPSPRTSAAPPSIMEVEPLLVPEPFNQPLTVPSQQSCPDASL